MTTIFHQQQHVLHEALNVLKSKELIERYDLQYHYNKFEARLESTLSAVTFGVLLFIGVIVSFSASFHLFKNSYVLAGLVGIIFSGIALILNIIPSTLISQLILRYHPHRIALEKQRDNHTQALIEQFSNPNYKPQLNHALGNITRFYYQHLEFLFVDKKERDFFDKILNIEEMAQYFFKEKSLHVNSSLKISTLTIKNSNWYFLSHLTNLAHTIKNHLDYLTQAANAEHASGLIQRIQQSSFKLQDSHDTALDSFSSIVVDEKPHHEAHDESDNSEDTHNLDTTHLNHFNSPDYFEHYPKGFFRHTALFHPKYTPEQMAKMHTDVLLGKIKSMGTKNNDGNQNK